ncbi:MAG: hypothetical protein JWN93_842 [Hyphomicrobiales bacterium]|nr:hypothetical protein [Hyphomicrobiales bacterium]
MSRTFLIARRPCPVPSRAPARLVALVALSMAMALGGCKTVRDVTGSIGGADVSAPADPQGAMRFADEWGRRYDAAPNDRRVALTYAKGLRATRRFSEAVAVLQKLAAQYPNDQDVLAAYGKSLADAGRLQEAANVLQGAHTPERPNWTVLSAQGSVADQMGDHAGAQGYYGSALKIVPGEPSVLSNLGLSYALTKKLPLAEQTLREASANPRADARVRQNLALVLALQGKFSEAEDIQKRDLPPDQAAANVGEIRRMIAQSNTWRQIQTANAAPAEPAARKPQR